MTETSNDVVVREEIELKLCATRILRWATGRQWAGRR